jgi:hypothetical protein
MQPKAQASATNAVMNTIPPKDPSKKGTAIAMVNPPTGEVVALAQNRLWGTKGKGRTTYNYAVDQKDGGTTGMQAGSTFKIFTLAAAMEAGFSPYTVLDSSDDKNFPAGPWGCTDGNYFGAYTVSNSTSSGDFNMLQGTAFSVNTYFVGLEQQVGLCRTVDIAKRTGMTLANGADLPIVQSFTLGSVEVSPLSLATSYATMANHGVYCKPHAITRIVDEQSSGKKVVSKIEPECQEAVSREVADSVTAILTHVVDGGIAGRTGAAMSLGTRRHRQDRYNRHIGCCLVRGIHPGARRRRLGRRSARRLQVPDEERIHQRQLLRPGVRLEPAGPDLAAGDVRRPCGYGAVELRVAAAVRVAHGTWRWHVPTSELHPCARAGSGHADSGLHPVVQSIPSSPASTSSSNSKYARPVCFGVPHNVVAVPEQLERDRTDHVRPGHHTQSEGSIVETVR